MKRVKGYSIWGDYIIPTVLIVACAVAVGGIVTDVVRSADAQPNFYDRTKWQHWIKCSVREIVLARDGIRVERDASNPCNIVSGVWVDPYSLDVITDPSKMDVDHVVPLKYAYEHGGQDWDADKRRRYANNLEYPYHLLAVRADLNRQKGAKGPGDWMPPATTEHCRYVGWFSAITARWDLGPSKADQTAIAAALKTCGSR